MSIKQKKPSILIVDESNNIKELIRILGNKRYHIRFATSSIKALELIFSANTPDLILIDTIMPDVDGYELCKEIKRHPKYQNIPIIFINPSDVPQSVERSLEKSVEKGLSLGAVDFITKPFHVPIIKARVKTNIDLKLKSDLLEKLALIDQLTNLPNRQLFDETLINEWKRCQRSDSHLSLILINIDYFKQYNDTYGHPAGDECLRHISNTLSELLHRPSDSIARYSGEKFAVLLPDTDISGAENKAKKLLSGIQSLEIPNINSSISNYITVSIGGVSTKSKSTHSIFVQEAEKMLSLAKSSGRNQIQV